jgi:DGQHR domain-containing protein
MFTTTVMEGRQGTQRFFTTSMRWGELAQVLVLPDQLPELDEDQRMQRGLAKKRIGDLVRYLLQVEDHFFSAVTLVILPRDVMRPTTERGDDNPVDWDYSFTPVDTPMPGHQRIGKLELSGEVRLFTADGQHRAKSALEAMRTRPILAREEVPVVLVPYQDPERVRQLFSDLNLNAKPISRTLGYAYETRNPLTLIAKHAADEVPLFKGRVNRVTNSLPHTSSNVITLGALVQGTGYMVRAIAKKVHTTAADEEAVAKLLSKKGNYEKVQMEVAQIWDIIVDAFGDKWKPVMDEVEKAAGDLRDKYLFPHGLGWLALSKAAAEILVAHGENWEERFRKAVASFDWNRTANEWKGNAVLHDEETGSNRVNNTGPAINDLAGRIVRAAQE